MFPPSLPFAVFWIRTFYHPPAPRGPTLTSSSQRLGCSEGEGLLEREQARALWDLEAERQECSLQPCRQEMELGLAVSPAICMWRWEKKVVRFDCIQHSSHASEHVLWNPPFLLSSPWPLPTPITQAVKIQSLWLPMPPPEIGLLGGLCCCRFGLLMLMAVGLGLTESASPAVDWIVASFSRANGSFQ